MPIYEPHFAHAGYNRADQPVTITLYETEEGFVVSVLTILPGHAIDTRSPILATWEDALRRFEDDVKQHSVEPIAGALKSWQDPSQLH